MDKNNQICLTGESLANLSVGTFLYHLFNRVKHLCSAKKSQDLNNLRLKTYSISVKSSPTFFFFFFFPCFSYLEYFVF